jgi:hypothetical protein
LKEVIKFPDVALLSGNKKNELLAVRLLKELYFAG